MVLVSQIPKPRPTHEKKRHGQHHRTTKHYSKTYWPYLPLFVLVIIGLAINSFWTQSTQVLGYATDVSTTNLLQQTNLKRTGYSQPALSINEQLTAAAQQKADDMAARDYWSHTSPGGEQPWAFVSRAGYQYAAVGENLAYGFSSSDAAVNGWMNSPAHRENLLNTTYSDVGFGIANVPNYQGKGPQTVIVAMYGAPDLSAAAQSRNFQIIDPKGATSTNQANNSNETTGVVLPAKEVTRLESIITTNSWTIVTIVALIGVSLMTFILRHGLLWHRVLVRSEAFVIKHHGLDVILVAVGVIGIVITRGAGTIH